MKKIIPVMFALLLLSVLPAFAQQTPFFENLPREVRIHLAESYNAVANRYESLGLGKSAESYRIMRDDLIEPFKESVNFAQNSQETSEDSITDAETTSVTVFDHGDPEIYQSDIRQVFDQYRTAFFSEDLDGVMAVTTDPFYIPLDDEGMSREELREMYSTIFDQYPVNDNKAEDVFRDDSIAFVELDNGYIRVDIQTNDVFADYFYSIPFWDAFQSYYFVQDDSGAWKLTAISATEASF